MSSISEVLERNGLTVADIEDVQEGMNLIRDMHGVDAGATVRGVLETVKRLLGKCEPFVELEEFRDARAILAEVLR